MYLKMIHSVNVGPIEDVRITFPFNEDKSPKPVVIVGENGTGKSILLSNIVDSFHEIASLAFDDAAKRDDLGLGHQFYKIISSQEIRMGQDYMYSYIQYESEHLKNKTIEYFFKGGNLSSKKFCDMEGIEKINFQFDENGSTKKVKVESKDAENIFQKNVLCYFPPSRYEKPNWLGNKYYSLEEYEHPTVKEKFSRNLDKQIVVLDMTKGTLQWLLDVIADSRCDVEYIGNNWNIVHISTLNLNLLNIARKNIEKIMSNILGEKVYFGLNNRSAYSSRFNINYANGNIMIPTLDLLSTGQSALFNMFATIVRYADFNDVNKSIRLEDITGIVVIDEIELHLHSNLQRDVLPKLLKLFPKVQFIISSHSPLFLLGMEDEYHSDGYEIYQMPSARKIIAERFSEFEKAYSYLTETETYQQEILNAIRQHQGETLIVTEGATDWKHMKVAFENLKLRTEYLDYCDMKFEFLEYEPGEIKNNEVENEHIVYLKMGKDALKQMCQEHAKIKQFRKIIFVADRDDDKINKELGKEEFPFYKDWGNNVFSFVLPLPEHRKNTPKICIEHYYTDDEIKTPLKIDGVMRRLYLGNEFYDSGIGVSEDIHCKDLNSCGEDKINVIDGCNNKPVCALRRKINLALPKMKFAEGVLNHSTEFANFNFDNFHLIFDVIKEILKVPNV